jgi:hypothetical protein
VPRALPAPGDELAEIVLAVVPAADAGAADRRLKPAINMADDAASAKNLAHTERTAR